MSKATAKIRCPHCATPTHWEGNPHRPFCSERCRLIDLGAWADEEYRIAGERASEEHPDNVVELSRHDKDRH